VATSDDLTELFQSELLLQNREYKAEQQLSEVTNHTNLLINSFKKVTLDLEHVAQTEKKTLDYINQLIAENYRTDAKVEALVKTLDRLAIIISEYSNIQLQTQLLIHSIEKLHTLVQMGLLNVIDIGQLPLDLVNLFTTNLVKPTVRTTSIEFHYIKSDYYMKLRIPKFSEPFSMYHVHSLPVYYRNVWNRINHEETVIVNSVLDVIDSKNIEDKCETRDDFLVCLPRNIIIRKGERSCALEIVTSMTNPETEFSLCKFDRIQLRAKDQHSLIKNNALTIVSSYSDQLHYICENSEDDIAKEIRVGLNTFVLKPNCLYETNSLVIYNDPGILKITESGQIDRNLDLVEALGELDALLSDGLGPAELNSSSVLDMISKFDAEHSAEEATYQKIRNDIKNAQEIQSLKFFLLQKN